MDDNIDRPPLPEFKDGETKTINIQFKEVDGIIRIDLASTGLDDDITDIAMLLAFTLEKLVD